MKTKEINRIAGILFVLVLLMVSTISCTDELENTTYYASDELTVVQTLEEEPEVYSTYLDVLHATGLYSSLHSYGSYTCLVPVNEVLDAYILERWGVNSVADLNSEEQLAQLRELVQFHTMPKSRATGSYIEGRMPDTTFTGDFLTTSFLGGKGISNILINRDAKLLRHDIRADNGIIHQLNKVLTPYADAVPVVMEKAGKHTIFIEALKLTGLYEDFLVMETADGGKQNFTILAESDSVFAISGINSIEDLLTQYADSTDYTNVSNGLNRFLAYHVTSAFLYSADMPDEGFVSTVLAKNAITIIKTLKELRINGTATDSTESWISLVMDYSNLPAKNGVYHTVDTIMDIFIPKAKHVIFDPVTDQPEYQAKLVGSHQPEESTFYQYVRWYPEAAKRYLQMSKNINLGYNVFDLGGAVWYEFDTPILPKGKYEFIICANGGNNARGKFQVYWDGEPIGSIYDVTTKGTSIGFPDSVAMEANGWRHGKRYITNNAGDNQYDNQYCMRRVITKELLCPEQARHVIRLVTVKSGGIPLDYFEFIPAQ